MDYFHFHLIFMYFPNVLNWTYISLVTGMIKNIIRHVLFRKIFITFLTGVLASLGKNISTYRACWVVFWKKIYEIWKWMFREGFLSPTRRLWAQSWFTAQRLGWRPGVLPVLLRPLCLSLFLPSFLFLTKYLLIASSVPGAQRTGALLESVASEQAQTMSRAHKTIMLQLWEMQRGRQGCVALSLQRGRGVLYVAVTFVLRSKSIRQSWLVYQCGWMLKGTCGPCTEHLSFPSQPSWLPHKLRCRESTQLFTEWTWFGRFSI